MRFGVLHRLIRYRNKSEKNERLNSEQDCYHNREKPMKANLPVDATEECTVAPVLTLGVRQIGAGHPVYIVAELSANYNQDYEQAVRIIHAAR